MKKVSPIFYVLRSFLRDLREACDCGGKGVHEDHEAGTKDTEAGNSYNLAVVGFHPLQ